VGERAGGGFKGDGGEEGKKLHVAEEANLASRGGRAMPNGRNHPVTTLENDENDQKKTKRRLLTASGEAIAEGKSPKKRGPTVRDTSQNNKRGRRHQLKGGDRSRSGRVCLLRTEKEDDGKEQDERTFLLKNRLEEGKKGNRYGHRT